MSRFGYIPCLTCNAEILTYYCMVQGVYVHTTYCYRCKIRWQYYGEWQEVVDEKTPRHPLSRRLGLGLETERLIQRWCREHGETFDDEVASIIQTHVQQSRDLHCEHPEMDANWDPETEGRCSHHWCWPKEETR